MLDHAIEFSLLTLFLGGLKRVGSLLEPTGKLDRLANQIRLGGVIARIVWPVASRNYWQPFPYRR
jgi:hypothetical protein